MYYVCIEENAIVSVSSYRPGVPEHIEVVEITDEQHKSLEDKTHYFNVTTKVLEPVPQADLDKVETAKQNEIYSRFLNTTDWQVMRHLRQKALGIPTTLTEEEYVALETERQNAANGIIKV